MVVVANFNVLSVVAILEATIRGYLKKDDPRGWLIIKDLGASSAEQSIDLQVPIGKAQKGSDSFHDLNPGKEPADFTGKVASVSVDGKMNIQRSGYSEPTEYNYVFSFHSDYEPNDSHSVLLLLLIKIDLLTEAQALAIAEEVGNEMFSLILEEFNQKNSGQ